MTFTGNKIGREVSELCGGLQLFPEGCLVDRGSYRLPVGRPMFHPGDSISEGSYDLYITPDNKRLFIHDVGRVEIQSSHCLGRVGYDEMSRMRVGEIQNRYRRDPTNYVSVDGSVEARDDEGYYPVFRNRVYMEGYSRFCEVNPWFLGIWFSGAESVSPGINRLRMPWAYKTHEHFLEQFATYVELFRRRRKERNKSDDLDKEIHRTITDTLSRKTGERAHFDEVMIQQGCEHYY